MFGAADTMIVMVFAAEFTLRSSGSPRTRRTSCSRPFTTLHRSRWVSRPEARPEGEVPSAGAARRVLLTFVSLALAACGPTICGRAGALPPPPQPVHAQAEPEVHEVATERFRFLISPRVGRLHLLRALSSTPTPARPRASFRIAPGIAVRSGARS
jgi:hypothetical protein